jgi:hypothetical protein
VRFKQALSKERDVQDYAQIIVVADGLAQTQSQWNATALELCKAMRKLWWIKGHNDEDKEEDDVKDDIVGLKTSLGTVKDKQSFVGKQKYFNCRKIGHRSAKCLHKKKKGQSEKAGAVADASVKKTKYKCSHCGKPGHKEEDCWIETPAQSPS